MISVVIPAYNAAPFIGETLDSVLNQTYQNFEIIVVDDGSSDDTVKVIHDYMAKDDRIQLIENAHAGVAVARNTGIDAAKHDWIALLDSDDLCLPERLEKQVAAIESDPDVIVWATHVYNIGPDGAVRDMTRVGPRSKDHFYELRSKGKLIYIKNSSATMRKDKVLEAGGYDPRFKAGQDMELWDRLADYGPIVTIPEPLVSYRFHGGSITAHKFEFQLTVTRFLEARNRARLRGETLDWDDFLEYDANRPAHIKLFRQIDMTSKRHYRNASEAISNKNYLSGVLHLSLATVRTPPVMIPRIWKRLAPKGA